MNKLTKGIGVGLIYTTLTAGSLYAGNGGIIYENNVPEESGTLNRDAAKTLDEQIKEKGWLVGPLAWIGSRWVGIGPSTLYGATKEIPNTKFVIDYLPRTVVSEVKGAIENPLETIATAAVPVVINNSGLGNKGGSSGGRGSGE